MLSQCRYPAGYSLVFIPYYSPVYTGSHWGVYDQNQNFYGYDDGDVSGELCLQWPACNQIRTHAAWQPSIAKAQPCKSNRDSEYAQHLAALLTTTASSRAYSSNVK